MPRTNKRQIPLDEREQALLFLIQGTPPAYAPLYTIRQVAALTGRGEELIRRWIRNGELKGIRETEYPYSVLVRASDLADVIRHKQRRPSRARFTKTPLPPEAHDEPEPAQQPQEPAA